MEQKLTIYELIDLVLKELKRRNYGYNTYCQFHAFYKKFSAYLQEHNEKYFSEELGRKYLHDVYDCTVDYYNNKMSKGERNHIRKIRVLGDYQLHGVLVKRIVKKKSYKKPLQFEQELTAYEAECESRDYSKRGMRTRLQRLYFFIDYLDSIKLQSVKQITPEIISGYVKTIFHHHEKSISSILTTLRVFLRFLYLSKFMDYDLSLKVPKQNKYYYPRIPSVWNKEEVHRMLIGIDRGNPTGKRDYAILLLVAKLGMRVGDVKSLMLSNLNWDKKTIEIIQTKTKAPITYPILQDIGWSLIDYLKNARPKTDSPYVFIRMNAPFEAFGPNANLHNMITKYTRRAGISVSKEKRHGLHSLRHTLASNLLENGTPLPVISEILGHINSTSTVTYLQTAIGHLRLCALDPDHQRR
ncbi:MAG: site-specific integrase [Bacillota bacterium]